MKRVNRKLLFFSSCDIGSIHRLVRFFSVFHFQIRYQYVLGERTWIEYWPTVTECTTEEHNSTCLAINEMVNEYMIRGCRN